MDKSLLASTLRDLATLVETSDEREYAVLLEIGIREIVKSRSGKRPRAKSTNLRSASYDMDSLIESLGAAKTRELGFELLEKSDLTRANLQQLARRLDLPVMREDNLHRLMERIVESSVGSRLNSLAIRGE